MKPPPTAAVMHFLACSVQSCRVMLCICTPFGCIDACLAEGADMRMPVAPYLYAGCPASLHSILSGPCTGEHSSTVMFIPPPAALPTARQ